MAGRCVVECAVCSIQPAPARHSARHHPGLPNGRHVPSIVEILCNLHHFINIRTHTHIHTQPQCIAFKGICEHCEATTLHLFDGASTIKRELVAGREGGVMVSVPTVTGGRICSWISSGEEINLRSVPGFHAARPCEARIVFAH